MYVYTNQTCKSKLDYHTTKNKISQGLKSVYSHENSSRLLLQHPNSNDSDYISEGNDSSELTGFISNPSSMHMIIYNFVQHLP